MRINSQMSINASNTPTTSEKNNSIANEINGTQLEHQGDHIKYQNEIPAKIIDKLNEFMEVHNQGLKFVYHDGLEEYFVTIVDSQTDEVIKEIPSKELLDAYYQMQKIIGNIVDEKI